MTASAESAPRRRWRARRWSRCRPTSSSSGARASSPRAIALQYAAPFSYIGVRYAIALVVAFLAFGLRARWPRTPAQWGHVAVAGLLSHAGYLGGSHYAQRWGLSAGITALVLALQPLLTAVVVSRWLHERLGVWQKVGVGVGLAGVALVVGPRAVAGAAVARQPARGRLGARLRHRRHALPAPVRRRHRPARGGLHPLRRDRAVMLPLGVAVEGFAIEWNAPIAAALSYHVVLGSIGAYSILHLLMRHGQATGVTSLLYLTPPVAALCEWLVFGVLPTPLMWAGMVVACVGVAMVTRAPPRAAVSRSDPAPGTP